MLIAYDQNVKTLPAAFATQSASPLPAGADPHGAKACELNKQARDEDRLDDDAVVLRIVREARRSGDRGVQLAAQMVLDRQAIAIGGEPEAILELFGASVKMTTACVNAGFGY